MRKILSTLLCLGLLQCIYIQSFADEPNEAQLPYQNDLFTPSWPEQWKLEGDPAVPLIPAYMKNSSLCADEDLLNANETAISTEITKKVEELKYDPVKIYEYVRNNIDFIPYYGSKLGATGTLIQKRANSFDQASLLIAMLRCAGIPCRYVWGGIKLEKEDAMNWLGVENLKAAEEAISKTGLTFIDSGLVGVNTIYNPLQEDKLLLHHVWVEALLPYAGTRGNPINNKTCNFDVEILVDSGERMWIPLDPSFKQYENNFPVRLTDGMPLNAMEFLNQFITASEEKMPDILYSENLKDFLAERNADISLEDLCFERRIVTEKLNILPTELPAAISIFMITGESNTPDDSDIWTAQFRAKRYTDGQDILYTDTTTRGVKKNLSDLYNKRITLSYSSNSTEENYFTLLSDLCNNNSGESVLMPELSIEGEVVNDTTNDAYKVQFYTQATSVQKVRTTIFNDEDTENPEFIVDSTANTVTTNPLYACDKNNYAEVDNETTVLQLKLNKLSSLTGIKILNVQVGFNVYQTYGFRDNNANYAECSVSNGTDKVSQKISVEREYLGDLKNIYADGADGDWRAPLNALRFDYQGAYANVINSQFTVTFPDVLTNAFEEVPHDCFLHVHHRDGNSICPNGRIAVRWGDNEFRFPACITDQRYFQEDVILIPEGVQGEYTFILYKGDLIHNHALIDYVTQEYSLLKPNQQMSSIMLNATNLIDDAGDLANLRFRVEYVGEENDKHVKFNVYNIFLIVDYVQTTTSSDDQEKIALTTVIDIPRRDDHIINTVTRNSGEITALHLNYDNTPNLDLLESRYSKLKEYEENIDAGVAANCDEAPVGELLNSIGCQYFYNLSQSAERLSSIMNMHTNNVVSLAVATQKLRCVTGNITPGTYKLDVFYAHTDYSRVNDDIAARDFNFISGMTFSAHEHKVFEDMFNIRSLSTMRILRMADSAGDNSVLYINKDNYTATPSFIYDHFTNGLAVDEDDIFIIPLRALSETEAGDSDLTTGYIHLLDPTGEAKYIISGGNETYNGGFLSLYMDTGNTNETFADGMYKINPSDPNSEDLSEDLNIELLSDGTIKVSIAGLDGSNVSASTAYELGLDFILSNEDKSWQEKAEDCELIEGYVEAYINLINANTNDSTFLVDPTTETETNSQAALKDTGKDQDSNGSDPVDMRTGEFYAESTDVEIPGLLPIVIKRNYSSQQESVDFIGYGWTLNLNYFLWGNGAAFILADNDPNTSDPNPESVILRLTEDDGSVLEYIYTTTNTTSGLITFAPDPRANPELVNISRTGNNKNLGYLNNRIVFNPSDKKFTYTSYDGTQKTFAYLVNEASLKQRIYLSKIQDIHGNYLEYNYYDATDDNGFGLPRSITSGSGSSVQFYYDIKGRVERIVSSDKREIHYYYDNLWNLVKVIDAAGSTTKYEYSESADGYLTHNLARIIKPDNRILENIYDGEKVVEQRMTIGFNATPQTIAQFEYTHDGAGYQTTNEYTFVREESDGEIKKTLKEYRYKDYSQCVIDFNDETAQNTAPNGTGLSITPVNDTSSYVDDAFTCPDSNTSITIGDLTNLVGATKTIEFNFKTSASSVVLYQQGTNTITAERSDNTLTLTVSLENLTDPLQVIKSACPADNWYHVCISLDTVNTQIKLYLNGILETTESTTKTSLIEDATSAITLKAGLSGSPDNFPGYIDNFGMYSLTKLPARKAPLRLMSTTEKGFQLSETEWEFNSVISKTYNDQGYVTSITDQNDAFVIYDYYMLLEIPAGTIDYIGDSEYVTTPHDYDVVTIYNYDSQGRVIETIIDPDGTIAAILLDEDGHIDDFHATNGRFRLYLESLTDDYCEVTSIWYLESDDLLLANKVSKIKDPEGTETRYTYDETSPFTAFVGALLSMERYDSDNIMRYKETYNYDATTHLLSQKTIVDISNSSNNVSYSYSYDRFGNLTSITNPLSEKTSFMYDEWGNKIQTTNPAMESTRVQYNNANMPVKITDPMGNSKEIFYDKNNNKIAETDPNGNLTTYLYDYSDSLLGVMDPNGNTVVTDHDIFGNQISLINQKGHAREFEYDGKNRLVDEIEQVGDNSFQTVYTYDDNGNILTKKQRVNGHSSYWETYQYNHLNQIIVQHEKGIQRRFQYDKAGNRTCEIIYASVEGLGYYPYKIIDYTYSTEFDGTYKLKEIKHYSVDRLSTDTREYQRGDLLISKSFAYDHHGNLISETDPMGYQKDYDYDEANRLVQLEQPIDTNLISTTTYDYDQAGRIIETTDPNNHISKIVYDKNGRVIRTIDPLGRQHRFEYDPNGNKTKEIAPSGNTTSYVYDKLNRNTAIIDEKQNTSLIEYDELGNVVLTADPQNNITLFSYDDFNRLLQKQDPEGYLINYSYTYDYYGRLIKTMVAQMDENGKNRTTEWKYNSIGQVLWIKEITPDEEMKTSFLYNGLNQLSRKASGGKAVYNTYDEMGNLLTTKSWEGENAQYNFGVGIDISFKYDANGNRTEMHDTSGTTRYTYYPNGLLETKIRDAENVSVQYEYDANGNKTEVRFTGVSLHPDINASQTISYTYNDANELTSVACNGENISYDYNTAGQLITKSLPQNTINYSYDALDRLTTIDADLFNDSYHYNTLGNIVRIDHEEGTNMYLSRYSYDAKNQLTAEYYKNATGQVNRKSYTYDGTGNRLTMVHEIGDTGNPPSFTKQTYNYSYNTLNQLESMSIQSDTTDPTQTSVDIWGINLGTGQLTVNGEVVTTLPNNVYIKTDTATSGAITISDGDSNTVTLTPDANSDVCYTYDDNGNLGFKSSKDGMSYFYLWDSLDRLKAIYYYYDSDTLETSEFHTILYDYNADGEKIFETRDGVKTGYLYDNGRLLCQYDASKKVTAQYVHGSGLGGDVGSLLFSQKPIENAGELSLETSYYLHNHRGDVVAVTNETGTDVNVNTYRYSAFGEIIDQTTQCENDILFSSKKFDSSTDLSYFGARYYDASIGRFISRDPLGYIDGPNGYIYVSNNPINLIDPFGFNGRQSNASYGTYGMYSSVGMMNTSIGMPLGMMNSLDYTAENQAVMDAFEQVAKSEYSDKTSFLGATMQMMAGGLGVDIHDDILTFTYDLQHGASAAKLIWDGAMLLPVVGGLKVFSKGADAVNTLAKRADDIADTGKQLKKYTVSTYDDLLKKSNIGDNLDIHHAVQKHPAAQIIEGYNAKTAPSIMVPNEKHVEIPRLKGEYSGTARDLLAKDIKDLRKYSDAPNSALKELINLNKQMYPRSFAK